MVDLDFEFGACGKRRALAAFFYPLEKFIPIRAATGAHIKKTGGIIRDNVRCIAAMGNDSVDTTIGPQMLSICVYTAVGQDKSIQGVNTLVGGTGSMGGPAKKFYIEFNTAQHAFSRDICRAGMKHHGRIHLFKNTGLSQPNFSAAAFLGRRAHQYQSTCLISQNETQSHHCAQAGSGNQVVTTAVANFGQRIIFCQNCHRGPGRLAISRPCQK